MKDALKSSSIDRVYLFTKCVQIVMACTIILQAVIRLLTADNFHTFTGFMLTFYLLIFGAAIMAIEFNCKRARIWFYFMNYSLGKCIFYFFMTLLCFGSGAMVSFFDILVGVIFGLMFIMFGFFHVWFKNEEPAFVQSLIDQMNKKNEEHETKKEATPAATLNVNRV